jgi:ribosomal protein S12 methylthiotransferase accessory factor
LAPATAKRYFHGTHRTCAPHETLARLRSFLSAMGITRIANVTGLDRTGIPVVMVCRPNARSVTVSQGKGLTLDAAKASGVMEALEVWHAERVIKPVKLASFDEMRGEHRVADVAKLPRTRDSRYGPTLRLLWIEGEDLLGGGPVWAPYELVSANYTLPLPPGSGSFQANTNGLASGNHWLEAVSHGLCEVVERDARTLWKQLSPDAQGARILDPESISDPACVGVIRQYLSADLTVRIWDTTTDVGIASFVCLLVGRDEDDVDPEFGSGSHPARQIALLRALTEAGQARNTYITGARDDYFPHLYTPAARARRRALCGRLLKSSGPRCAFDQVPNFESLSIEDDLRWMLARLRAVGIDQVIAVDLTREAIGVPVARVIVPGLEGVMNDGGGDYRPGDRARRRLQGAA